MTRLNEGLIDINSCLVSSIEPCNARDPSGIKYDEVADDDGGSESGRAITRGKQKGPEKFWFKCCRADLTAAHVIRRESWAAGEASASCSVAFFGSGVRNGVWIGGVEISLRVVFLCGSWPSSIDLGKSRHTTDLVSLS